MRPRTATEFLSRFLAELVKERYASQGSLFSSQHWQEDKHPRVRQDAGDHKPGQFAPKNTGAPGAGPQKPAGPPKQANLFDDDPTGGAAQPVVQPPPPQVMDSMIRRQEVLDEMLGGSQEQTPEQQETPQVSAGLQETPQDEQQPEPEAEQQGDEEGEDDYKNDPEMQDHFAKLTTAYRPKMLGLLRHLGVRPEEAEDIYQDAVMDAWNNLGQYEPQEGETDSFRKWLKTKVKGKHVDFVRRQTAKKRGSGKTMSLDAPTGTEGESTLASGVASKQGGVDSDLLDEIHGHIQALSKSPEEAHALLSILQGERTWDDVAGDYGISKQSLHNRFHPIVKRVRELQTTMRERNSILYAFIEGEIDHYFRNYTLVRPIERYNRLKATGNTLFGHLLRGILTVVAFHLANGAFSAKTPRERQQSRASSSGFPGGSGGSGGGSPSQPSGQQPSYGAVQNKPDMESHDPDENQMSNSWFDGAATENPDDIKASLQAGKDPNAQTQVMPGAAALYPKPGDTQNLNLQDEAVDSPSDSGPQPTTGLADVMRNPAHEARQQERKPQPKQGELKPASGGSMDNKHPHVKAGDPKGRGGQFAPKGDANKETGSGNSGGFTPDFKPDTFTPDFSEDRPDPPPRKPSPPGGPAPLNNTEPAAKPTPKPSSLSSMSQESDPQTSAKESAKKVSKSRAYQAAKDSGKGVLGEWQKHQDAQRAATNHSGKRVSVGGKNGTVSHAAFGKHRILFDDGTHALHSPDEIGPEVKKKPDPEYGPSSLSHAIAEADKPKEEKPEAGPERMVDPEPAPEPKKQEPAVQDVMKNPAHEARKKAAEEKAKKEAEAKANEETFDLDFNPKKLDKQLAKDASVTSKSAVRRTNLEKVALENDLDHEDFEAYVNDREKFDGDQWQKDRDFQAALRKHMGVDTAKRRKANAGKKGHEEFHDAENALSGNIPESQLVEHLGHDVQDWDHKAYDMATDDHELSKPGAHDEEWLSGVLKDYLQHRQQASQFEPQEYDDSEQFDELGQKIWFARSKRGIERATWRAEFLASINNVLARLR